MSESENLRPLRPLRVARKQEIARDIHLFDEGVQSPILNSKIDEPAVEFHTLPVVDGYYWSSQDQLAGLRPMIHVGGNDVTLTGQKPTVSQTGAGDLQIVW